jgi:hypothetical protein
MRNARQILEDIESSDELKSLWAQYRNEYPYAENVAYGETISALRGLLGNEKGAI